MYSAQRLVDELVDVHVDLVKEQLSDFLLSSLELAL
jgi:hypothetical protein